MKHFIWIFVELISLTSALPNFLHAFEIVSGFVGSFTVFENYHHYLVKISEEVLGQSHRQILMSLRKISVYFSLHSFTMYTHLPLHRIMCDNPYNVMVCE